MKEVILLFHKYAYGYSNRMMNDRVIAYLAEKGYKVTGEKFRDLLGVIRRNDSCTKYLKKYHGIEKHAFIVSESSRKGGYWWTEDLNEMKTFWENQHKRICETMSNAKPLYVLFGYHEQQLQIIGLLNQDKKSIA